MKNEEQKKEINNNTLEKIETLFTYDLKVKNLINMLVPSEMDFYDDDLKFKYKEKLEDCLDKIKTYLNKIMLDFKIKEEIIKSFNLKISELLKFIESPYFLNLDYNGISSFIQGNITNMSEYFVYSVYRGFIGYMDDEYGENVKNPNTINEYLNYVHSYVTNNYEFYNNVPSVLELRCNISWMGIYLRGIDNNLGRDLFKKITESGLFREKTDRIDILNLKKRILIMARDLGHATVIDVDLTNENEILVSYFIPKNTNQELMAKLKGININSKEFGTGKFISNKDNLIDDLCEFMKMIPTDLDMDLDSSSLSM